MMTVGYRFTITLTVIMVFAILFSMVYISDSKIIQSGRKATLIKELEAATGINTDLSKMIEPKNICFAVNQDILDDYPALADSIEQADNWAENDIKTQSHYGNYYTGVGLELNKTQIFSLLNKYDNFNQTASDRVTPDNLFTYKDLHFSCGFSYKQNHYQLNFTFSTLAQVNRDVGYVPVHINRATIEKKNGFQALDGATFVPFNNTVVFFNELSSPVTIEVNSMNENATDDAFGIVTTTIPPNKMSDLRFAPNWSSFGSVIYHYKVREYPWVEGKVSISPRYSSECMSKEIAKSLYSQSNFALKFPSYLPEGFKLACNGESSGDYVIQIYVNQTAIDYYTNKGEMHSLGNPYPFYLYASTPDNETKGIFHVHAQKYYLDNPLDQQHGYYQFLLNNTSGFITNPKLFEVNGISFLTYNEGKLSHVDLVVNASHERYRIVGTLPMDEMIKIAKSLS